MKKLFLLSAISAIGVMSASAQMSKTSIIFVDGNKDGESMSTKSFVTNAAPAELSTEFISAVPVKANKYAKTTASGSRWYNYINHIAKIDGAILSNEPVASSTGSRYFYPMLWNKYNAIALYSDGPDTIGLVSYAAVFDPTFPVFNDDAAYAPSDIGITSSTAYTLDSVRIWGLYSREPSKAAVVDTIRLAITYGRAASTNLSTKSIWMPETDARWGADAVNGGNITKAYFPSLRHDSVANRATSIVGAPLVVTYDIYLNAASAIVDSAKIPSPTGTPLTLTWDRFSKAINLPIPANNMIGISSTFISGDASFTPYDTIKPFTANPKYNHFLPLIFEEKYDLYPTYYGHNHYADSNKAHYNMGYFKTYPQQSWGTYYTPSYAFVNGTGRWEVPYIDYKISCTGCKTVGEITSIRESNVAFASNAYPNPANTELNIPFTISEKGNVNVSISNILGQVVATQTLTNISAGQAQIAKFNTSNLVNGIYIYSVESNGQRVSNRFSVAH